MRVRQVIENILSVVNTTSISAEKIQRQIFGVLEFHIPLLKLNDSKTEFIVFGSASILKKVKTKVIQIGEEQITAVTSVRNIGAYMDSRLKMEKHVNMVCKAAWFHLFRIGKLRQ